MPIRGISLTAEAAYRSDDSIHSQKRPASWSTRFQRSVCSSKPRMSGHVYAKELADALVITWDLTEPFGNIQDFTWFRTENLFQTVLHRDGTIEMAYKELTAKDAIVDRKSTRLNSSHVANSYAVFCLKKKRKTNHASLVVRKPTANKQSKSDRHSAFSCWSSSSYRTQPLPSHCCPYFSATTSTLFDTQ